MQEYVRKPCGKLSYLLRNDAKLHSALCTCTPELLLYFLLTAYQHNMRSHNARHRAMSFHSFLFSRKNKNMFARANEAFWPGRINTDAGRKSFFVITVTITCFIGYRRWEIFLKESINLISLYMYVSIRRLNILQPSLASKFFHRYIYKKLRFFQKPYARTYWTQRFT